MSQEIVHRFDVHVAGPDSLEGEEHRWKRLVEGTAVGLQVKRMEQPPLLEVELRGGARAVAGVLSSVAVARDLSIRDEVTRGVDDRALDEAYPDPRALFRMGVEPGLLVVPVGRKGPPVTVAIVDSGLMVDHPDLRGHLWTGEVMGQPEAHGARCIAGEVRPDVTDRDGHGTRLAGTVLAAAGRAQGLQLMAVKFFDVDILPGAENATAAINFAVERGADVIVLSWDLGLGSAELERAIRNAEDRGVLVVIAAGNSGSDNDEFPTVPARYARERPGMITVMATNRHNEKASFSNYGRDTVDLAAPGTDIMSTRAALTHPSGAYVRDHRPYTGTSAAAAHVAGAAALLKLLKGWEAEKLKRCLFDSVDRRPAQKCASGGRLDLGKALQWRESGGSAA